MNSKFKFPSAYSILLVITIIMAGLTYLLPASHYDYKDAEGNVISAETYDTYEGDKTKLSPIPNSNKVVDPNPQGLFSIIKAPIKGFLAAGEISIFVLVVGALLGVINRTRAIDVGVISLMQGMKNKITLLITMLVLLFSIGGTTFGMGEETVAFYPILIPIMIAAGFDAMAGCAIILIGAGIGTMCSTVNPFATGVASGITNISLGDGMLLRLVQYIIFVALTIVMIQRYAFKVLKNPALSVTHHLNQEINAFFSKDSNQNDIKLTNNQKTVLAIFGLTFAIMIYSVIPFSDIGITIIPTLGWWFTELSALFLLSSILVGIVAKLSESEIVTSMIEGAKDVLGVVLVIGVARGISIIMVEGRIIDTILALSEQSLLGLPKVLYINVMYLIHVVLSFFIPSTSGLATISMPIMAPMADMSGVSRSIVITAYQSASGLVNLVTPTSGILMGALILSKIPYECYLKFIWKYLLMIMIATMLILSLAVIFNFG